MSEELVELLAGLAGRLVRVAQLLALGEALGAALAALAGALRARLADAATAILAAGEALVARGFADLRSRCPRLLSVRSARPGVSRGSKANALRPGFGRGLADDAAK